MKDKLIFLHDYAGFRFTLQLAYALADEGYKVIYAYSKTAKKEQENIDNNKIILVEIDLFSKLNKNNFIKRFFQERRYGIEVAKEIIKYKPDIVLSANAPLDAQSRIFNAAGQIGAKFIFWWQDVNSIAATSVLRDKFGFIGQVIGRHYQRIEKRILEKSDYIVPITAGFFKVLNRWNVRNKKVKVIENWAPIEELPVRSKLNNWSREHKLADNFCFLFTGSLGFKHHPEIVIEMAKHFKENANVRIVVVSQGFVIDWIKTKKEEFGLNNLVIFPYQSTKNLPEVLATADVLFATLSKDAGIFSAPSKILTYLCAKRSILFIGPNNNLISNILKDNLAGMVVNPLNVNEVINGAELLLNDKNLRYSMARGARRYAENNFDITNIVKRLESLF